LDLENFATAHRRYTGECDINCDSCGQTDVYDTSGGDGPECTVSIFNTPKILLGGHSLSFCPPQWWPASTAARQWQHSVNSDRLCQCKPLIFDPPTPLNSTSLNRSPKNLSRLITATQNQLWYKSGHGGGASGPTRKHHGFLAFICMSNQLNSCSRHEVTAAVLPLIE